jgi:hypothetical protein
MFHCFLTWLAITGINIVILHAQIIACASCDDFFNFNKVLPKREYLAMLYALLDIKVTGRRFESFNSEMDKDELISMIEILFTSIETQQ